MYSCLYVCTRLMPKPETHRALFKKQTKKNKRYEGTERKHGADGNPFGVLAFSFAASSRHAGRLVVLHLRFMLNRKFSLTHTRVHTHTVNKAVKMLTLPGQVILKTKDSSMRDASRSRLKTFAACVVRWRASRYHTHFNTRIQSLKIVVLLSLCVYRSPDPGDPFHYFHSISVYISTPHSALCDVVFFFFSTRTCVRWWNSLRINDLELFVYCVRERATGREHHGTRWEGAGLPGGVTVHNGKFKGVTAWFSWHTRRLFH